MNAPVPRDRPAPFAVTHRSVLAIAIPMTVAQIATPLIGVTDTAVIGRLGVAALVGAIALGALLFDFLGATFNFLRTGTTGLTAQALGAGDDTEQVAVLVRALILAVSGGLAIVLLQDAIAWLFLDLMGASADVDAAMRRYFGVRVLGMPVMFANYAVLGWLLGLGRARGALALQVLLGAGNIVLCLGFVLGLGWGIAGVAGAAVAAETVTLLAGAIVVVRLLRGRPLPSRARLLESARFRRMLAVNRDIMIRSFALMTAFALFTAAGARTNDATLAANAILMNFFMVGAFFLDGMASAAEQFTGRSIGARYEEGFRRSVRLTLVWSLGIGAMIALAFLVTGPGAIDLITTAPHVRALARVYLPFAALTPLTGALAFQMDGVYIGATWSAAMRNWMLVALALYAVAWETLPALFGNTGLWLALHLFLIVRGLTLLARVPAQGARSFAARALI